MRRRLALQSEILLRRDDPASEAHRHKTIHLDARRQRILFDRRPVREPESILRPTRIEGEDAVDRVIGAHGPRRVRLIVGAALQDERIANVARLVHSP